MTRIRIIFTAFAALALFAGSPASADAIGEKIAACVQNGTAIQVDGKAVNLLRNEDFRVVSDPKGRYGVQWRARIQTDAKWASAADVARRCIDQATGQVAAK